jgi:NAD(P) transhydrogenase subunit beta
VIEPIKHIVDPLIFTWGQSALELTYLVASILFIFGLKMLSHPDTARKGNLWAAFGMAAAIITTIIFHKKDEGSELLGIENVPLILGAMVVGTIIGWVVAKRVKMTAMPQLVSLFNGMGGGCAALISLMEFPKIMVIASAYPYGEVICIVLGAMIGTVSFAGSMIAFGKLNENIGNIRSKIMRPINLIILLVLLILVIYITFFPMYKADGVHLDMTLLFVLFGLAFIYGIVFVMPIGGADMPVVISLLNSFTGLAAAFGGFLYNNQAMLTGGILVGSAGTILTVLMCKAMNRSLVNVIVGAFGGGGAALGGEAGTVKEISLSDAAVLLIYSQKIVIVPGYGLAVAQAQHICHELDKLLEEKGVNLRYAIHPVAGRMPGHMNVLLAEADVPYEKLVEMDDINPDMHNVDVVIIIGANDVVNPAAENDPSSPIYGMPIIKALDAKNVIVMKRGMGKGYAAIENMLFYHDKTRMLFGDAKGSITSLVAEIKQL